MPRIVFDQTVVDKQSMVQPSHLRRTGSLAAPKQGRASARHACARGLVEAPLYEDDEVALDRRGHGSVGEGASVAKIWRPSELHAIKSKIARRGIVATNEALRRPIGRSARRRRTG
jgi:hypothetical protein